MPESLNIVLDNPNSAYFPGSAVSGKVIVETDRPMKYEYVNVNINVKAESLWTDGLEFSRHRDKRHHHSGKNGCHCRVHKNNVVYFSTSQVVWKNMSTPDRLFPSGVNIFPFHFSLPENMPSSFEGQNGNIRYTLHGQVQPSLGTPKSHCPEPVSLTIPVRQSPPGALRHHQQQWTTMSLILPNIYKNKKKVTFLDCESGTVTISLDMDQTSGFVIGEEIPLRVYVENDTTSRIVLMASITKDEVYTFRKTHVTITRKVTQEIDVHSSDVVHIGQRAVVNLGLTIPSDVVCSVEHCDFISLHYFLNLKVETNGTNFHAVSTNFPIEFTNSGLQTEEATAMSVSPPETGAAASAQNLPSLMQGHSSSASNDDADSRSSTKLYFSIPKSYENNKQVVSLNYKSGQVILSLDMPQQTEFNASEELPLCVKVTNSSTAIIMLIASVIKHAPSRGQRTTPQSMRGYHGTPNDTSELNSTFSEAIEPEDSRTWRAKLSIPTGVIVGAPPNTKYFLKFNLREVASTHHSDVYMSIPVSINHIHDDDIILHHNDIVAEQSSTREVVELDPTSSPAAYQQDDVYTRASEVPLSPVTTNVSSVGEELELTSNTTAVTTETYHNEEVRSDPPLKSVTERSVGTVSNEHLTSEPPPTYDEAVKYLSILNLN